jgi:hypothetical protein
MAHKTLIGGTAYEIKGGKTLVNGTVYEVKGGKTLVGGTTYSIPFSNFTLVHDFGNVAVVDWSYGDEAYFSMLWMSVPNGYEKCNIIAIDGVEYEIAVAYKDDSGFYSYMPTGPNCPLNRIMFDREYEVIEIYFFDYGTYNIQIGYVE